MAVTTKVNDILRRPRAALMTRPTTGFWGWLLQRVSAVLLFVALGAHTWVLHYQVVGREITYQEVVHRFGSPWLVAMDISLLVTGVYHAVNGLRAIIFDFGLSAKAQRAVTVALTAFGAVVLLFGINTLMVFLRGSPFLW